MNIKTKTLVVVIIYSIFLLESCKNSENKTISKVGNTESKVYSNRFENPLWIEKYSEYVSLYNDLSDALTVPLKYYDNIPETGPRKGIGSINLVSLDDYPLVELKEAQAIQLEFPKLDTIAAVLADDYKNLMKVMNNAVSYYERNDFEDDNYAQGKAYHKLIKSYSTTVTDKLDNFGSEIKNLEKELQIFQVDKFKKEGLLMRYHMAKLVQYGQEASNFANVKDMETFAKTDSLAINGLIQNLIKNIKDANELAEDEKRFAQEFSNPIADSYYEGVIRQSNRMVKNLRALKSRIKKNDFTRSGIGFISNITADGLPDALADNYNQLINEYNNLN